MDGRIAPRRRPSTRRRRRASSVVAPSLEIGTTKIRRMTSRTRTCANCAERMATRTRTTASAHIAKKRPALGARARAGAEPASTPRTRACGCATCERHATAPNGSRILAYSIGNLAASAGSPLTVLLSLLCGAPRSPEHMRLSARASVHALECMRLSTRASVHAFEHMRLV